MSNSIYMSINYGEDYKAVVIHNPDESKTIFMSGDVVGDYMRATVHAIGLVLKTGLPVMESSSVHHFVSDVPGYYWDKNDLIQRKN